ncbi:hypothetical protein ZWY2020_015254 [Hordeum vulgare]|nr:hypothetical protein ZWY2020_015254 [Hordeum vulgare]
MIAVHARAIEGAMGRAIPAIAAARTANDDCIGGRFWALVDGWDAEDGDDKDASGGSPAMASPTPSDMLCELLAVSYSEEEVAELVETVVPTNNPARSGLQSMDQVEIL